MIQNAQAYVENLWNWKIFDGCFKNTKISVSDIDGVVERNGHFLFIETKAPGVKINMGQSILLAHLAKMPKTTVVVVWGKPGVVESIKTYPDGEVTCCTTQDLRDKVKAWFKRADSDKRM